MLVRLSGVLTLSALMVHTAASETNLKAAPDMRMSVRDLFGVARRQNTGVYQPAQEICKGVGTTCAAVCGDGYKICASQDNQVHCFDPTHQGQTCCPVGNGDACDSGTYCARIPGNVAQTVCCPSGSTLAQCAAQLNVAAVTTDGPITTAAPTFTAPTASIIKNETISVTAQCTTCVPVVSPTITPSVVYPASNMTTATIMATGHPTFSIVPASGAEHLEGATVAALAVVAAGVAALL